MRKPRDENRTAPRGASGERVTGDLASRIAAAQRSREQAPDQPGAAATRDMSGLSRALRIGSEFIAAILVGAAIGFLLDLWLGTQPWIMLVMVLVGFAAGIVNVTRTVAEINKAAPPPPGSDLDPAADDDDER
jgi:ATP synthase protein I